MHSNLHETDFYGWTQQQVELLRKGKLSEVDVMNLIEEIEDMGGSEKRELESRLGVLFMHLLKWRYQPTHRGHSWRLTIAEQRSKIARRLRKSPSLKSSLEEIAADAYSDSRYGASRETALALDVFPDICPWTLAQALDGDYLPDYMDD